MTACTAIGLAVGAVALAAQRHVLRRPQPLAEPDRMAADDAIRSRSLHVLAAAGMVLVGSCLGAQLDAAAILGRNHVRGIADVLIAIGFPIAGRILAYWPRPARATAAPGSAAPEPA